MNSVIKFNTFDIDNTFGKSLTAKIKKTVETKLPFEYSFPFYKNDENGDWKLPSIPDIIIGGKTYNLEFWYSKSEENLSVMFEINCLEEHWEEEIINFSYNEINEMAFRNTPIIKTMYYVPLKIITAFHAGSGYNSQRLEKEMPAGELNFEIYQKGKDIDANIYFDKK